MDCAVDFSPGGVWIDYIRPGLKDISLIFCGTDCVLLAGCQLFLRRVSEHWTMATNGAAVVEDRAGITFGVELYVPWDSPEAIVYISSAGVVPLRHIPDVIGLVGRREGCS